MTASASEYRPDIDGLRAIAVLLVLLFHAWPNQFPGGYLGVDIFFVISGYLITRNIVRQSNTGRFSILGFYTARVKRIYPALICMLSVVLLTGWLTLQPLTYQQLGKEALASTTFVANLYFWFTTNYFNQEATNVLLHIWSLGVEEQFYIVWPIAMIALIKSPRPAIFVATLLAISLTWNAYVISVAPTEAFFSPFCRAWELMAGALLAFLTPTLPRIGSLAISVLALVGIALVTSTPIPLVGPIVAVASAVGLIAFGTSPINRQFLALEPLRQIGLVSYPLYLWHWPVFALLQIWTFGPLTTPMKFAAIFASLLLAWLTYSFVETPKIKGRPRILLLAMGCLAAVSILIAASGIPGRVILDGERSAFVERYERMHRYELTEAYGLNCDFYDNETSVARMTLPESCHPSRLTRPAIVIWGDSHAQALYAGVRDIAPTLLLATSGCAPSLLPAPTGTEPLAQACRRGRKFAVETISQVKPEVLILAQRDQHEHTDWNQIANWAAQQGVGSVVLVGPVPEWRPSLPSIVAKSYWDRDRSRVSEGLDTSMMDTDRHLQSHYGSDSEIKYVSMIQSLCNARGCLATVPGAKPDDLIALDYGHLSPDGSKFVGLHILRPHLIEALKQRTNR